MRKLQYAFVLSGAVTVAAAQSIEPPLAETRLTVHTLVREDVFAGFLDNDMTRFSRAERNIEALFKARPAERANLLAWRAGTELYRAVTAHESRQADEFTHQFELARNDFAEAAKLTSGNDGVAAITGGSLVIFADRLPQERRAAAWTLAYDAYSRLWKEQGSGLDKFPVHMRGEVLAGMAQAAQRTGRAEEAAQFVDRLLLMTGTPYEKTAKEWKANPATAATSNVTCKSCHGPGRLSARIAALK